MGRKIAAVLFAVLVAAVGGGLSAHAGLKTVRVGEDTVSAGIDSAVFQYSADGVTAGGGNIIMTAKTGIRGTTAYLATVEKADNLNPDARSEVLNASFVADLSLGAEKRFALGWGIWYGLGAIGIENSSYFYVERTAEGNCGWGVRSADENGVESEVVSGARSVDFSGRTAVALTVFSDGSLALSVGGEAVDTGNKRVAADGYIRLEVTGSAAQPSRATISDLSMRFLVNQTPANVDAAEDFEGGRFNASAWYSRAQVSVLPGSGSRIENGAAVFRNVGKSYFSTRKTYSDFELDFTLSHIQRRAVVEDGKMIVPVSSAVGVQFGCAEYREFSDKDAFSVTFLPIGGSAVRAPEATALSVEYGGRTLLYRVLPERFHLWSPARDGQKADIKIKTEGENVSMYLKYGDETGFTPLFSLNMGKSPVGYVKVYGRGDDRANSAANVMPEDFEQATYSLDRICIVNRDIGAQYDRLIYTSNKDFISDYEYRGARKGEQS